MSRARARCGVVAAVVAVALGAGCTDAILDVASGGSTSGAGAGAPLPTPCSGKYFACGDGLDNDADGLVDAADPECLGACDNTEDSYFPDLPGSHGAACRADCFWDDGNGAGNDDCAWDHRCDPLAVAPDFPPEGSACAYDAATKPAQGVTCASALATQSTTCLEVCGPLTPNGCDCFGCCELPAASGSFVWLGVVSATVAPCGSDNLDDPIACPPCTPVTACMNPCDECELCLGKPEVGLGCVPHEGRCGANVVPCGAPGEPSCAPGFFCITGCCIAAPK